MRFWWNSMTENIICINGISNNWVVLFATIKFAGRNFLRTDRPKNSATVGQGNSRVLCLQDWKASRKCVTAKYDSCKWCLQLLVICLVSYLQISHEAPITGGFGAEISASIVERCFSRVNFAHSRFLSTIYWFFKGLIPRITRLLLIYPYKLKLIR